MAEELSSSEAPVRGGRASGTFLNLSNHPHVEWTDEQRRGALALAGGNEIVDLPFPAVGPEWSEVQLERLARDVLEKVPRGVSHAQVVGEFTLAFDLVRCLQTRGVRCYAATTVRRVRQEVGGRSMRQFDFVRFREYPGL